MKEEVTVAMIKEDQSFNQRHIFIKMSKPFFILLRMVESNQPHLDKLRFMVLMVDGHLRMSISELNDGDYFPPVTELEDDKINNVLVMMVLLNTSQMIDMCSVLRMVFHPNIITNYEVKY